MRFYHLLAVVFVGLCVACGGGNRPAIGAVGVYTESELLSVLQGKTAEQVIGLMGRPDRTAGDNRNVFHYDNKIKNPYTGKLETAFVYFENGVVTKIKAR